MKNSQLLIGVAIVIIAVAVGGIFAFSTLFTEKEVSTVPATTLLTDGSNTTQVTDPSVSTPGEITFETAGPRYLPYSKTTLESHADKRRVLFFYANWCPTCQPAQESFQRRNVEIPEDVVVIRVNYNDTETDQEEKDLAQKYAVTYQHTYVQIDSEGKFSKKWNGGDIDELLTNLK